MDITNNTWRLEDIDKTGIIDRSRVTLAFDGNNRFSGHAGCNRYMGTYELKGNRLTIAPSVASTLMACRAESLMNQEQRYLRILAQITKYHLDNTGALILSNDEGKTLLFREDY